MGRESMKLVHQARGLMWEQEPPKRLRPLAPKLHCTHTNFFHLKSFIRPESGPIKLSSTRHNISNNKDSHSPQHPGAGAGGGTRWNPTQQQIGILEMIYRGGMRTPNAQQIEQITAQLAKYGKIEPKNVFYWFQNHKARDRQKHKRNTTHTHSPPTPTPITTITSDTRQGEVVEREEDKPFRNKCRSWAFECFEHQSSEQHRTLELFPLHPEGR